MATHHAIAATTNAIRLLLEHAAATSEWATGAFAVAQADDLQKPIEAGKAKVTIHLHRVALSTARRDRGPRVGRDGQRYRPSLPVDLHYLVSAWSADARTAQQLLGWAIRRLDDTPVIPTGLLNAYQAGLTVFAPDETVELVWEPLSLSDLHDVWQVATQSQAPSATYVARMVRLDSDVVLDGGGLVQERAFDYAQGPA